MPQWCGGQFTPSLHTKEYSLRSSLKLAGTTVVATVATLVATTGFAFADGTGSDIIKDVGDLKGTNVAMNLLWIIIGAVLVIFMQAGFALVETGFCRAKHAAHVVATNFAIFGLGFGAFFVVGYWVHVWRLLGDNRRRRRARYRHLPRTGRALAHR